MPIKKLISEIEKCAICADLPLGPRPLFQLAPQARILIAGQAPGRLTHLARTPFQDASGERLREWLGIDAATFYDASKIALLPMGFCYPGTGKGGDLPPRPECAAIWRRRALSSLPHLELTLVIGRYAIDWHLPEFARKPVTDVAQAWDSLLPDRLALPHPSPRNNRWLAKNPWFEAEVLPRLKTRVKLLLSD